MSFPYYTGDFVSIMKTMQYQLSFQHFEYLVKFFVNCGNQIYVFIVFAEPEDQLLVVWYFFKPDIDLIHFIELIFESFKNIYLVTKSFMILIFNQNQFDRVRFIIFDHFQLSSHHDFVAIIFDIFFTNHIENLKIDSYWSTVLFIFVDQIMLEFESWLVEERIQFPLLSFHFILL